MKYPIYITEDQIELLKYEILSQDFYIRLTRDLLHFCEEPEYSEYIIARKNTFINLSRTVKGGKIYNLSSDDDGFYHPAEYVWHDGNFLLIFRDLSTPEFIEFMGELLVRGNFEMININDLLEKENASFRFINHSKYAIDVFPIEDMAEFDDVKSHPNIRVLISRMENNFKEKDYSGVLHSSANVFETMAKDIIGTETIEDKTLKSFFERYRKESLLSEKILDYIISVYDRRNTEPLAGHGSTKLPTLNKKQATTLKELTKAFVKIEYQLKWE